MSAMHPHPAAHPRSPDHVAGPSWSALFCSVAPSSPPAGVMFGEISRTEGGREREARVRSHPRGSGLSGVYVRGDGRRAVWLYLRAVGVIIGCGICAVRCRREGVGCVCTIPLAYIGATGGDKVGKARPSWRRRVCLRRIHAKSFAPSDSASHRVKSALPRLSIGAPVS